MPKRVLVIALLFCLGGVLAIWDVLSGLLNSRISVNFAVLLLPVGIGLLQGKRRSQWWARFWIILGYILCGLLIVTALVSPRGAHATFFHREFTGREAVPYLLAVGAFFTLCLVALHRVLYSEKATSYFARNSEPNAAANAAPSALIDNSGPPDDPPSAS